MIAARINYRKEAIDRLTPYFRRDKRFYLLAGDMGFGAIDKLRAEFSDRIINVGIMEPAAVGIAAGMSMSGLIPIFYTIVNFLVYRSLEQIRNDVALQQLNVKFVGTGANDYFRMLGESHCCGRDDVRIMELIGVRVYDPHIGGDFEGLIDDFMTDERAGYLRV
jgi:transketolase